MNAGFFMNVITKIFFPEEIKTAKCRWCGSLFEYSESEKPAWPCSCWRCSEATEQRYQAMPKRRPEHRFFTRL